MLDKGGVLHVFDEGFNPQLESDLPAVLAMLSRGENVSAAVIDQAEQERLRYRQSLAQQGLDERLARAAAPSTRVFPNERGPMNLR